jgi:serine/threonine protein kinase
MIFLRTLSIIASLHSKNLIHRNINLDNICVGRGSQNVNKVYLIDFSLAEEFRDTSGAHVPFDTKARPWSQSIITSSQNQMLTGNSSRRDDIESLFYTSF